MSVTLTDSLWINVFELFLMTVSLRLVAVSAYGLFLF
jgi:hypothetical protein